MPIEDLRGAVLRSINTLNASISFKDIYAGDPSFEMRRDTEFIFGGYSWIQKKFKIWRFYFDNQNKEFVKQRFDFAQKGKPYICMIGDKEAKYAFAEELVKVLKRSYGSPNPATPSALVNLHNFKFLRQWDLEPFDALCSLLKRRDKPSTVGGSPQMVKVYQYMNSKPVGVFWQKLIANSNDNRTLLGRRMQAYERSRYWFIDPDTHISYPGNSIVMEVKSKSQSQYAKFDRALLIEQFYNVISNYYLRRRNE